MTELTCCHKCGMCWPKAPPSHVHRCGSCGTIMNKQIIPSGLGPREKDPNGKNPHEPGAKLDAGKICVWRGALSYFPRALREVASVSTFGATKYAWKGWESVPDGINRYSDALGRHLLEEGSGEVVDHDSGLLIAAHSAWNALARLELMLKEKQ